MNDFASQMVAKLIYIMITVPLVSRQLHGETLSVPYFGLSLKVTCNLFIVLDYAVITCEHKINILH